jgi:phosphoserine phosphatase RsbU/P
MPNPDRAATQRVKISTAEDTAVPSVTDPYLREQLELRQNELKAAISAADASQQGAASAPLAKMLQEVDAAVERMDAGTYGICDLCHDTIEKERLIADPLATLCLDHLSAPEQRALERDLELASVIQRGLLPQPNVRLRDWQIHYRYRPAGMVSGDYCDVIAPSNDSAKPVFLVGDVSGKGVAAALLMSHLHAMFRSLSAMELGLDRLLETANRLFCESTVAGQFATLICVRAIEPGEIEVASAGHLPAILVTRTGAKRIGATGLPLGMFSKGQYGVQRVQLDSGDSLLLFTDGISEASGPSNAEYGIERISAVAEKQRGLAPSAMAAACLEDVERYSGGSRQADDQTLMVIQRL